MMAAKDKAAETRKRLMEGEPKSPSFSPVFFTTGCTLQDLVLGGGQGMGYRAGTLVNVVAINQGGKSQGAAETVAHNYHRAKATGEPFWWNYIIRERRWSFDTKATFGVEVASLENEYPHTIEEWDGFIGNLMDKAKGPGIIVTDSLDAFSTEETEERAAERQKLVAAGKDVDLDGSYTVKTGTPALLSETLRIRMDQAAKTNTLMLVLSQVRSKLDASKWDAEKLQRNGGKALDHWCNEVVWLKPLRKLYVGKEVDGSERCIGVVVKMWTTKSSTPRPYRECVYTVLFDYGIDNIGSNIDFLFNLRNPKTGAFWGTEARNSDCKDDVSKLPIYWGAVKTLEAVVEWLGTMGGASAKDQEARAAKKEETGKANLSLEWLDTWIAKDPELQAAYVAKFPVYTRDQLIRAVEADKDMESELTRRVVEKWEQIEQAASSNRRSKFT